MLDTPREVRYDEKSRLFSETSGNSPDIEALMHGVRHLSLPGEQLAGDCCFSVEGLSLAKLSGYNRSCVSTFSLDSLASLATTLPDSSTETVTDEEEEEEADVQSGISSPKHTPSRRLQSRDTLILIDFDDTLCPSSHKLRHPGSKAGVDPGLAKHEAVVINLLHVAASIGQVQIVTMAKESWVHECITDLMPSLWTTLSELKIPIVSARTNMSSHLMREAMADERVPAQFLKTKVFNRIVRSGGWSNILSIGDSEAERLALQDIVFRHSKKDCLCKTVLLEAEPELAVLTAEVQFVSLLLPVLASHIGDAHYDIDQEDVEMLAVIMED